VYGLQVRSGPLSLSVLVSDRHMGFGQETALNHVWMSGLAGDGFGATHEMIRNDLIWVVACMCIEVDAYPAW
jgi:hypothetical protein